MYVAWNDEIYKKKNPVVQKNIFIRKHKQCIRRTDCSEH